MDLGSFAQRRGRQCNGESNVKEKPRLSGNEILKKQIEQHVKLWGNQDCTAERSHTGLGIAPKAGTQVESQIPTPLKIIFTGRRANCLSGGGTNEYLSTPGEEVWYVRGTSYCMHERGVDMVMYIYVGHKVSGVFRAKRKGYGRSHLEPLKDE
ncbi:hypothetical protein J3459_022309 [Metarhizium acridum]|uniref:uncharacterized protein n=1 Tax=Metarhizium acridum TaxID=92637 RepID=UPI001C6CBE4A|nr:hypothetical protein J3459_022309 [Metarhizium acridum]KAG8412793.1 hypothetical protein J3458_013228 [Metarhizium acridum]